MRRKFIHTILTSLALLILSGCSVEKNTRMSRFYHNMTAHYNVYFNGKESLKSGVEKIDNSVENDYTNLLPVFKSNEEATAKTATSEMEYAIQKASKLIKLHSITKKPKRRRSRKLKNYKKSYVDFRSKEEYNNWIDDAYILMGQSYFYMHNYNAAIENFAYVTRKFKDEETKYDASVWLIRSYTMLERYIEAYEVIQSLNNDEDFPHRLEGELALVTADYHIHQLEYKEAIPFLSIAIKKTRARKNKLHYKYILAQLYEETDNLPLASQAFREIAHMNPPYKMAFNARIKAAEAFNGTGNADKLKKELRKMLRDQKNEEFRDQIYFAMGNIAKSEGNIDLAKDLYIKSAAVSQQNMYQRALSCLTLADLYFAEPDYVKSKAYYDSAVVVIDDKYPRYEEISERHDNLSRLVDNILTVEKEDSLQRIAQMSEAERNAMIDQWIKDARELEQKQKEEQSKPGMDQNYYQTRQLGLNSQQQSSGWYFYTPTTVAYGRITFQQKWGKRKLEDGWRRSSKLTRSEFESEELATEQKTDTVENVVRIIDPKERNYYLQDLPLNDSLMARSNARIRDALFNASRIFKTVYKNYSRAINSLLELNERFPENSYQLPSYFELWDLYTLSNDPANAEVYKNKVIRQYPESKYAKYLQNPNYFIELEAQKDSINTIYRQAFLSYKQGKYSDAGRLSDQMFLMDPDTTMIPKLDFFKTIAAGTSSDWNIFESLLNGYILKYPKGETTPLAEKILTLIQDSTLADYQKLVEIGYLNDEVQNEELQKENMAANDEFGGKFSYDEDLLHYFVIAYPANSDVDINRLKFDIANYNIDHYTKLDFDIETEKLGTETDLVIVRALENKETSLIYFRSIIRQREVFQALKDTKYVNFVVSSTNYREITADKNYNEYLKFFIKNYSRFITGDFTEEALPSPEELMAKAKAEDEELEEKGTFVMVNYRSRNRIYQVEADAPQSFVIAVNDPSFSMRKLLGSFSDFNRKNYKDNGLKISQEQVNDYRMIIIKSFDTRNEALQYFTKVVTTRDLFESLGTMSYRNFLISEGNLTKLLKLGNIENYINFFSDVYLKGLSSDADTDMKAEDAGQPLNQALPEENRSNNTEAENYQGAFNNDLSGTQTFVLALLQSGVDTKSIIRAIQKFNSTNYPSQPLKVSEEALGNHLILIKTEGLKDDNEALKYLKAIVQDSAIYDPLQEVNCRNFIFTNENMNIFRNEKNVADYMNFFKVFYVSRIQ